MRERFSSNRSLLAFRWTCNAFQRYTQANRQKLYFWTFTFLEKMPDHRYAYHWGPFIRDVLDLYRQDRPLYGVKVTEPHRRAFGDNPWRGLHYHCVVNHRIPVGEVRRIGKRYGIGRVHVREVKNEAGAFGYLGKYLRKGMFEKSKLAVGIRRWSVIGGFDGVKVSEVEMNTPTTRACRAVKAALGRSLEFHEMRDVCESQNIFDKFHLAFVCWYAKQDENAVNPLAPLRWPWWYLDREIGLPENPMDGKEPF